MAIRDGTISPGHWLQGDMQPGRSLLGWGAVWAAGCGALASGGLRPAPGDLSALIAVLFVAGPLLGSVWRDLETLAAGEEAGPVTSPPVQGARPRARPGIQVAARTAAGLAVVLALAGLLGAEVAAFAAGGLVVAGAVVWVLGGRRVVRELARAGVSIGLAWCLGYAAFFPGSLRPPAELVPDWWALETLREWADLAGPAAGRWLAPHVPALVLAAIFSLITFDGCRLQAEETAGFGLGNLGLAAAVAVVAAGGQPLPAAAVGVLGLGQVVFQPGRRANGDEWFLRRAWLYVMGCMLLSALGVALMRR